MINLKDKKILVTGGSRGIGKEIVNFLLKAGAEVMFTYHSNYDKMLQNNNSRKKVVFFSF